MTAKFTKGLRAMIADAEGHGGGRHYCCSRGRCATHLAEDHPDGGTTSTMHVGDGLAIVWNYGEQELAGAFARAALDRGVRELLGRVR